MNEGAKREFISKTLLSLGKVLELHESIKDLDISLAKLYPVTLVEDNKFFVFDLDESGKKYEYKIEAPTPMQVPKGVLAAFPLDFYHGKASAVISDQAFKDLEGYAFIFHEFVHCFQWENGEKEIRASLEIERKYKKENKHMWEINHPFPYDDPYFIRKTDELFDHFRQGKLEGALDYHSLMGDRLENLDYEYMIWQEWKEGFARYVENLIRDRLDLKPNRRETIVKFDRASFYEIGSRYIDLLIRENPHLKNDIEGLYYKMSMQGGPCIC